MASNLEPPPAKKLRTFRPEWLKQFDWLKSEDGKMFCLICTKSRQKNIFATGGCTDFQMSSLTRHMYSPSHRDAVTNLKSTKTLMQGM